MEEKDGIQRAATKHDVRLAFNLILGREPESEEVLDAALPTTVEALYQRFINSEEFLNKWTSPCFNLGSRFKKSYIQIHASVEEKKLLQERTARQWGRLGAEEPHWSVLTHEKFMQKNIDLEEFYQTGQRGI